MKYLIPVDGSDLALDAVRHGLKLVRDGLQASFVIANVQEPPHLYEVVLSQDPDVLEGASHGAGEHALQGAQSLMQAAGVPHETEIGTGDPAHVLVDIAERFGCDGVIIAARGLGGLRSVLLGSVSSALLQSTTLPVTVVHRVEEEPLFAEAADEADEGLAR